MRGLNLEFILILGKEILLSPMKLVVTHNLFLSDEADIAEVIYR